MYLLETVLLIYFAYVTVYSFLLGIAALFYKTKKVAESTFYNTMAVFIPAYKEDAVITNVARQALNQDYPADKFDVVVIADSLKPSTIESLKQLRIRVIEVSFDKSTKVRSLNRAMEILGDRYECAVVLDADNVMEPAFLRKMNNLYNLRYLAIQGRRCPKNDNTKMALLDGLSETINNYVYRQGNVAAGLPSCLNGSGMFFDYKLLRSILATMDPVGGFDRELEYKLLENNVSVYYAKHIEVYDEKVQNAQVFEKQRTRWLSSQFVYLRLYFVRGWKALFRGNFSYFNSTVLRNMQLPRLVNLGGLALVTAAALLLSPRFETKPAAWLALLSLNVLTIALAIPKKHYNLQLLRSIVMVPLVFAKMVLLLFRLRGANKTFIHTPHGHVTAQDSKTI